MNQALLQHVAGEQVKPVMQQISQLLAPFDQRQSSLGFGQQGTISPGFGQGLGMQAGPLLNMSPADSPFQNPIRSRPTYNEANLSIADMSAAGMNTPAYMPLDQGNGKDQFGRLFGDSAAQNTFNTSPLGIGSFLSGKSIF
jgi:hypothetical protein